MKTFWITGASAGIGKALAELVLENGDFVYGMSRSSSIEHSNYKHISIDLGDLDSLKQQISNLFRTDEAEEYVLINNAGTLGDVGYVGNISNEAIKEIFDVNITAPALLMNEFIKQLKEKQGKKIILNISSGVANYAIDGWSGYCATKAALNMWSEVVNTEIQKQAIDDIRIFSVAPGVVDTGMQDFIRGRDKKDFSTVEKFLNLKKQGQLTNPKITAKKLMTIINSTSSYQDVVLDVRNIK